MTIAVFFSSSSETALDAIELDDSDLGVILHHALDSSTYVSTTKYMPPVRLVYNPCRFSLLSSHRKSAAPASGLINGHRSGELFTTAEILYESFALSAPFEDHVKSDHDESFPIPENYPIELRLLIGVWILFKPDDRPDVFHILETAQTKIRDNP